MFFFGVGELTASLVLAVMAAILFYWSGRRERHLLTSIPGPRRLPVIGNAMLLLKPRQEMISLAMKLEKIHGQIMFVQVFWVKRVILTSPEAIKSVLSSQIHLTKDNSYRFIKPWLGTGLLTCAGDKWRPRRRMLDPAFHYKILEDFVHVFNANSAILAAKLGEHLADEYVEINDYVSLCALDIICETTMGTSVQAQSGKGFEYVRAVKRMCRFFLTRHFAPWIHPDLIYRFTRLAREEKKVVRLLQDFSGNVIRQKMSEYEARKPRIKTSPEEPKKRLSLLEMLLEISSKEGKLTTDEIREEVDTFMFAGHDTTAAAISWALFLLGAHQNIQDKLVSELRDIFGSDRRQPTVADFQNMTYLDKVIKEVLRLYPSVPLIARLLESDVTVGEYTIPAGTNVMMMPLLLHRNPDIYPDPDKFDPERFSPEQSSGRHPYAYIPFSAGPRNCIGQKFARLEMMSVISTIIRNFKLESLDKIKDVTIKVDITTKPTKPFKIKFSPRV